MKIYIKSSLARFEFYLTVNEVMRGEEEAIFLSTTLIIGNSKSTALQQTLIR